MILGHEPAGSGEAVGENVPDFAPGDHVIVRVRPFCGRCKQCLSGQPNRCNNRSVTQRGTGDRPRMAYRGGQSAGITADTGGFAEKMLTHENGFVKIPKDVPLGSAALIGCAVVTGVGAVINTAKVEAGSSVAGFGAGGIGLSAIQGARSAGARRLIAGAVKESKLTAARGFGATHATGGALWVPTQRVWH